MRVRFMRPVVKTSRFTVINSFYRKSGVIEVLNADTNVVEGYVSALKDDQ